MTVQLLVAHARRYLWNGLSRDRQKQYTPDEIILNGALNYRLHEAYDRLMVNFGEITLKDIAMMIEAWIMAQGTLRPAKPYDNVFKD
jgi:hypothetical protein